MTRIGETMMRTEFLTDGFWAIMSRWSSEIGPKDEPDLDREAEVEIDGQVRRHRELKKMTSAVVYLRNQLSTEIKSKGSSLPPSELEALRAEYREVAELAERAKGTQVKLQVAVEERKRRHKRESGERLVKETIRAVEKAIDAVEGDALGSEEA